MLSHSEGTDRVADPYRCCFGFKHTIVNLSDHPAVTGEWLGEPLDFLGADYAGLHSSAAGRYQITKGTWLACKAALRLPDFTAACQDDAAILLIKQKGGLDLILAGRVGDAIEACRGVWASLPGSASGQPQRSLAQLINAYGNAGGSLA
jgi:muramidase (phage lysozyme)